MFQECIIRFYRNITTNSLQYLTCDIKHTCGQSAKYQLLNLTKIKQRTVTYSTDKLINTTEAAEDSMSNKEEENHNKEMVRQHLSLLDEKSRRILELYYLEGKDMKTIAEEIGYKNADVAKKRNTRL
ncbi:MAG: sigma-70 family RNA polymerase sigma factor [Bacteroidetes bacterium]|nr:sigma-70 family RNA polymerase sigma factor [Bacteroidota bacterium]